MFIIGVIYNLSIVVALSVFSGFLDDKFKRNKLSGQISQGLLFGTVVVIGMLYPFVYTSEVQFDSRSIVIGLSSIFFGPVSGTISTILAIVCRIYIGGETGVVPGITIILTSFIIGILFYNWNKKSHFSQLSPLKLYYFGLLIHLTFVIIISIVQDQSFIDHLRNIIITILGVFPVITMIAGKVLLDQERNAKYLNDISEREELFRTTLYSIGDAVITTDINGLIMQMNPVAEKLTGWKEIDAKENNLSKVFNIINEKNRNKVESPVDKIIKEGKIIGLANHTILVSKNSTEIPIADSGAPIHDSQGNTSGVVLVFRDQTNERKSQKALHESQEIFHKFMEYSPIYVFFKDSELRAIRLSKNYEQMLGKPMDELLGKSMFDLFPSDLAASIVEDDKKILNEGKVVEVFEDFNNRNYRTIKFPIHIESKPLYLAGYTIDITEAKKAEEAVRISETNLREIYNSTNEAIFIHDAETGKIIDVNDQMIKMYGFDSKEEVLNADFDDLSEGTEPFNYSYAVKKLKLTINEGPQTFEWLAKKKSGESFWVEVSLRSSEIGGVAKILAVARDISERKRAEEELSEAIQMQQAILKHAEYAIIATDEDGIIKSFNPAAEIITGYSAEEIINIHTPEIFHDSEEVIKRAEQFSLELGEKLEPGFRVFVIKSILKLNNLHEWKYVRKDGKIVHVLLSVTALYDSAGNITGFLGIAQNISERKESDRLLKMRTIELEESEEKYRILFEQSKDAMLLIDNHVFVDCNDATLSMLLYKSKDELFNTHPSALSPEYQPDGKLSFEKAEEMMNIAKAKGSHRFEWVHRRANGEDFYVEVSLTIIPYQNRQIIHTAWRDISDRKEAEEKILKLSKGIEQSPATIIISDKKGKIEYVNPKFTEVSGFKFEEVFGKNINILKSGYHDEKVFKELWENINQGKMWNGELLNKKKNGELFWENVSISPIRNEAGEITNFIAVKEDISERKKMMEDLIYAKEKAEKANLLKSEFLAQMSHEIRSPINTIVSFTSLIEDELHSQTNDELDVCFTGIESASKRVIRTIDLILNMSELQLGTYEISKREIYISDILNNLLIEYMKRASSKKLELTFNSNNKNAVIVSDEYAVSQIFANLIDNAIKYTEKGIVDIKLVDDSDDNLTVTVSDTGIGISSEYLGQLFEPFSQEEQGYSRKFEGNGLGMSLVKRYCDLIGADISVKSVKNKGTIFTVILSKSK